VAVSSSDSQITTPHVRPVFAALSAILPLKCAPDGAVHDAASWAVPIDDSLDRSATCARNRAGCSTRPMLPFVTAGAQGNQVRVVIVAPLAAELLVMDLQVLPGTTNLASPAVAAKHLLSQLFVRFGIKPQTRSFGSYPIHEAFSVTSCRKARRCSPGRNLKNRDMDCRRAVGSSLSRFAPARKSAQIISRQ
jgi:hypothetical protein